MMLTYVGLDLGVDTSVLTNSCAPKFGLRQRGAINSNSLTRESHINDIADGETSLVIDIVREHVELTV
jgi:hypothetical protein